MAKKTGKRHGVTDNLIGVILEKHTDADYNLVYEAVYKVHPIIGRMYISNTAELLPRLLGLPWRLSLAITVWGDDGSVNTDEQVLEQRFKFEEVDPLARTQLEVLVKELEDSGITPVKIGYRIHILGR